MQGATLYSLKDPWMNINSKTAMNIQWLEIQLNTILNSKWMSQARSLSSLAVKMSTKWLTISILKKYMTWLCYSSKNSKIKGQHNLLATRGITLKWLKDSTMKLLLKNHLHHHLLKLECSKATTSLLLKVLISWGRA